MSADYFRGDQKAGVTPPNLLKPCDFADHIVNARGKKTAFTSVSTDRRAITRFGECHYVLLQLELRADGHDLIEHDALIADLVNTAKASDKEDRTKAVQALRYAKMRKEGLISWKYDISRIPAKDVISWTYARIQSFFKRV